MRVVVDMYRSVVAHLFVEIHYGSLFNLKHIENDVLSEYEEKFYLIWGHKLWLLRKFIKKHLVFLALFKGCRHKLKFRIFSVIIM